MTGTDAELARNVRREFGRRPMDSTRLDVQVSAGRITLTGTLAVLREQPGVNLQSEVILVTRLLTRDRLVKAIYDQLTYSRAHQGQEEDHNVRGRSRGR